MDFVTVALEIAVQDSPGVAIARELRAERVELAQALSLGGLTPSPGALARAVDEADESEHVVEVHVLIRPRAGDFDYDRDELATATADVRYAVANGASGVVVGCLGADGRLDRPAMRQLIEAADGAPVTLHRAIDVSLDPVATLEAAIELGITRVLTSGGASAVGDGLTALQRLVTTAAERIEIMAGGGVTADNAAAVAATGVQAVHFSAKRAVAGASTSVRMGSADSGLGGYETTDRDIARAIAQVLGRG